jgi:hypothetical protein
MTHEELLARVQYNQGYQMGLDGYKICSALRAVVELHRRDKDGCCSAYCVRVDDDGYAWHQSFYPCPTIQAIEKELG